MTVIQRSLNVLFDINVHQRLHDVDETSRKREPISVLDILLSKSTPTERQQNIVSQMENELPVAAELGTVENITVSLPKDLSKEKTSAELPLAENCQCTSTTFIEETLVNTVEVMEGLSRHDTKAASEGSKSIHGKVIH